MRKARPWAVLLTVSVVLAACGDDDPSQPDFTEETAEQTADAAEAVVGPINATGEVGANVGNAFGALFGLGGTNAVSPMLPFEAAEHLRRMPQRAMPMPSSAAALSAGVLIPEEVLGTTYVWSSQEGYVASEQTGAPTDGVRFIYYATDAFGVPAEPLEALGHMDFVDVSTTSLARLEVQVVRDAGNVTLVDYFVQGGVTGNLATTTVTLDAAGFISDGSESVDFDFSWILSGNETSATSTVDMLIANESEDASLHVQSVTQEGEDSGTHEGTFTVEHGDDTALFEISGEYLFTDQSYVGTVEGSLSFNGEEIVVFDGDEEDPVFTRPDGGDLTAVEVDALARMWGMFWVTQAFGYDILLPFYLLLAFSAF